MAEVKKMEASEFVNKITLGNVLTVIPMLVAALAAYYDLRSDAAAIKVKIESETMQLRRQMLRDVTRIEKLQTRDDVFATTFALYQHNTVQALTRLETQMMLLLQERRLHPLPAPLQSPQIPSRQ